MKYKSNYDKTPIIKLESVDERVLLGSEEIAKRMVQCGSMIFILDIYPGVLDDEVIKEFSSLLSPDLIINTKEYLRSEDELRAELVGYITDDRVFGFMCHKDLDFCFDKKKLENARQEIAAEKGRVLIVGVGASMFSDVGTIAYFDISRWEIQLRYRKGASNWLFSNGTAPQLTKYKIGFFIEWRMADRHKMEIFDRIDFFVDTHTPNEVKGISGDAIRKGLREASCRPFRLEPYFDPGVWGGQWMKEKFDLPEDAANYAWSFDGVPEENAINLGFCNGSIKLPAIDLVLYRPHQLLGEKVHGRYGAEFPIRFDLLDTIDGGNLSLQVHPLTEYIQHKFGMNYTQDESYYILDAKDDACVFLGLKENVDKDAMFSDLRRAERGEISFDAEKYVNKFLAKKHDHFLIPAGTVHCSGRNSMVLEISATPYIFTFKMWDWDRVGLDGLPRPVHINHGEKNVQWDRTTKWVEDNLVNHISILKDDENLKIEKTGLNIREPIITTRISTDRACTVELNDSVQMLNLVEGEKAIIKSIDGSFKDFEVHYTETFIVPASVGKYEIVSPDGAWIKVLCAEIR